MDSKFWFWDKKELEGITDYQKSARWNGDGFYCFVEPSGTMMPETSPGEYTCGTKGSGWLNGKHPEEVGLEVEMEACFDHDENSTCEYKANITVTNCNNHYVYHLVELDTSAVLRYCGTNKN